MKRLCDHLDQAFLYRAALQAGPELAFKGRLFTRYLLPDRVTGLGEFSPIGN
jgi:hypothetical protein